MCPQQRDLAVEGRGDIHAGPGVRRAAGPYRPLTGPRLEPLVTQVAEHPAFADVAQASSVASRADRFALRLRAALPSRESGRTARALTGATNLVTSSHFASRLLSAQWTSDH